MYNYQVPLQNESFNLRLLWQTEGWGPEPGCQTFSRLKLWLFVGLQVNSVNCNTSWKIVLFMKWSDNQEVILKGVSLIKRPDKTGMYITIITVMTIFSMMLAFTLNLTLQHVKKQEIRLTSCILVNKLVSTYNILNMWKIVFPLFCPSGWCGPVVSRRTGEVPHMRRSQKKAICFPSHDRKAVSYLGNQQQSPLGDWGS